MSTARAMFRYVVPVDGRPHIIPLTCSPVALAASAHDVEFWAEHAGDYPVRRAFQVFGTGHPLPEDARWVGTAPRTREGFVWHLYELPGVPGEEASRG